MILKVTSPLVLWIKVICKGWYCCLMWFLFLISWWDPEVWDHLTRFLGNWPPKLARSSSTKDNCLYLTSPVLTPLSLSLCHATPLSRSFPSWFSFSFSCVITILSLIQCYTHFYISQETRCLVQTNADISICWLPTTDWLVWNLRDNYF